MITIDNFHIQSKGHFQEIDEVPEGFKKFFESKSSIYYTNEDQTKLIRVSDHWGLKIRKCAWFLVGYPKISSFMWQKMISNDMKIGIIDFKFLSWR